MTIDDDFRPRLGRIRTLGNRAAKRYVHRVLTAVSGAGGWKRPGTAKRFSGSRIGRGSGVGRVLAARDRYGAFRSRRVIIKTRIVKLKGAGMKAAQLHLRYIQRDGVTRDGAPGQLYDASHDHADGKAFLERGGGDRHQFRFIVSPEDGAEYADLKPLTRRLMAKMEQDLGTKLDWVAVDHYNTGHPHTHVVVRGTDETGRDLIIARDYLTVGMRERAAEIISLDLGPRTDREIEDRLRQEVEQERFTSLDRTLLREMDGQGMVGPGAGSDPFRQSLYAGRLQKLRRLGLAEEIDPGRWHLSPELEPTLRALGERGDIIKAMHRALATAQLARGGTDLAIYDPADPKAVKLVGRVIERGLADEINDRHYLIVDGIDGRTHYVGIGRGEAIEPIPEGGIVAIEPKRAEPKAVDRTIAEIAAAHGGRYGIDIHLRHDPAATAAFAETHVRRLEAMRRLSGTVERQSDGTWIIAPDHLERAASYERMQARAAPVTVHVLSPLPLDRLAGADAATWLDRELVGEGPSSVRDAGFGREVKSALSQRRQWLIDQGLAEERQDQIIYRRNLLAVLRRRELVRVAGQLSGELGLPYAEAPDKGHIEGIVRRRLDLVSGRFAVIEKSREFTLVPWRPVLERSLGKPVAGIVRGESISWTVGRQRGVSIS